MKIAAAYIRVSTDDQLEYSPDSQLEKIRAYAKQNDMILPEEFIFREDEGISGKKASKRPEFMHMIGTAKKKPKPFDCIIVWKFSRFARNRQDSIVYKSMLRKQCSIDVVSVTEQLGDDKMSIIVEAMIEAMDEYYSINLAEEVKRGMNEKVRRGEPVTAPSFGYNIKDKQYIVNKDTAPIVKMIFQDFVNGMGYHTIAQKLNAMGIQTKRGGTWENRTIEYILRNPVYIGKIRWNSGGWTRRNYDDPNIKIVASTHEPIISDSIWEQTQVRIAQIKAMYGKYSRQNVKSVHMLQGLVKCSTCGLTLSSMGQDGMQCIGYTHGRCSVSHYISIQKINALVFAKLEQDLKSCRINLTRKTTAKEEYEADIIEKQLQREKQKLIRVHEAYESGVDTLKEYEENKQKISARITQLGNERPYQQEGKKESLEKFCAEQKKKLKTLQISSASPQEKNTILRTFVDKIVFDRAFSSVEIFYYI